jgi:pimeloyl-ACP methyl ester carboxylesterase
VLDGVERLGGVQHTDEHRADQAPEEWVREAATISDERSPRDPTTTRRHLAAGRAQKSPPLSGITVPTLVISGEDDPIISVRGGRDTARAIPGATLLTYPDMGHDLPAALWPEIADQVAAVSRRGADAAR